MNFLGNSAKRELKNSSIYLANESFLISNILFPKKRNFHLQKDEGLLLRQWTYGRNKLPLLSWLFKKQNMNKFLD